MKKLKIGYKDRSPKEVVVDGVTFMVKPMSQEVMAGLALYSSGQRDSMMTTGEKKEFLKSHLADWKDLYDEDDAEVEFSIPLAIEYFTHDDYDDLFMLLYWKSIELANLEDTALEENKEAVKK